MNLAEQARARNASRFREFLCVGYPGWGRLCGKCGGLLDAVSHYVAQNVVKRDASPQRQRDEGLLHLRRLTPWPLRQIGATVGLGAERTGQILADVLRRETIELI